MFKVDIVADSIMPMNHRITSMLITFPRYILAEFNTHRALSRNSASSRAIPTRRIVEMVKETPFIPLKWMEDHSGMQGTKYLDDVVIRNRGMGIKNTDVEAAQQMWLMARDNALRIAGVLNGKELNVSKQIVNRLLEPFMWHTILVTATEWENFFALRDDLAADIHMQHIAHMMLEVMNVSTPKRLKAGEWHMPFGDQIITDEVIKLVKSDKVKGSLWDDAVLPRLLKISTARCARTSYLTFDQIPIKHDYTRDILQTDSLIANGHMSPLEHCAKAMSEEEYEHNTMLMNLTGTVFPIESFGWCGNFRGFIQYRKTIPNENRTDPRLIKHTY